ncbi:unnamed protein product [Coffea canephora]|uniref:BTB domain-containing protein n=1 Tax=Coffea canephora TaxID=49390 RepID=A0A068U8B3_COFCA|nr:unnamed protein product [Coffea canephora]
MHDSTSTSRHRHRREPPQPTHRRRSWCCSFAVPPQSPENHYDGGGKTRYCVSTRSQSSKHLRNPPTPKKTEMHPKSSHNSFPNSPQSQASTTSSSSKLGLRKILSPGRVSPIDEPAPVPTTTKGRTASSLTEVPKSPLGDDCSCGGAEADEEGSLGNFDVRLNLKARNGGGSLILELSSAVLAANSSVFAGLIADYRTNSNAKGLCRIEVPDVDNLGVFRETIELMFDEDIPKKLVKIGPFRAIDMLEVAAGIKFVRGVSSCLKFLEAVPWTEEEEEKLRVLFTKYKFDDGTSRDILARLYALESVDSQQTMARQLLWSIITCVDTNAGNELKSLVKGLLSKSSVYEKDCDDIERDDIFAACQSCLSSLISLFEEASGTAQSEKLAKQDKGKPMIERISKQVDNLNWLFEILLEHQMAEQMVDMWADQADLIRMHESSSPMIRYELSRVSAMLFIALGTRKLHCPSDSRLSLLSAWFRPMLLDFGWLQRCKKGLDMKALEEAMGQALLTLPLKEQYTLFMDWFCYFSKHGTECPNLSKAFQIWWRRSFLRGSETYAIESR